MPFHTKLSCTLMYKDRICESDDPRSRGRFRDNDVDRGWRRRMKELIDDSKSDLYES